MTEHYCPIAMPRPVPTTGTATVDQMIREGRLTPASNPGGVAALPAMTPVEPSGGDDTAEVVSELREDRL